MHGSLQEGARVGRFVLLRNAEGQLCAIAPGSVPAICETENGALLMISGGKLVQVPQ